MISEICPGYTALYQNMPDLVTGPTEAYRLPDNQRHPELRNKLDFTKAEISAPFRLLEGIGTDWQALQMGQPLDFFAVSVDGSAAVECENKFVE